MLNSNCSCIKVQRVFFLLKYSNCKCGQIEGAKYTSPIAKIIIYKSLVSKHHLTKHAVPCRLSEFCGNTLKNITSNLEDTSIFMLEWNDKRLIATTSDTFGESSHRCKRSPWSFRDVIL